MKKIDLKLTKNQPPSPVFLFFAVCLFFLLVSRAFSHHHSQHHIYHQNIHHKKTPNHLSLSLFFCKALLLYYCDPSNNCSNDHLVQRLSSFPLEVGASNLPSATPTTPIVSNFSTDHGSSNVRSNNSGGHTHH